MALPIERFKESYKNWRYNPFTGADMAVDKEEDNLFIPSGSPFLIQLLEQPRKNTPTSVTVYCYDDIASFTEVVTSPSQGEFRVDYPPEDGEGTGLIEFNQNDADKQVKINYKATGSPALAEYLDTKVSYPAGSPAEHQILGFVSGAPEWRYNPVCYFHDDNIIYHPTGENESCLIFRFKRSAKQATVLLELKGELLHQGYYTELKQHLHAKGTLAGTQPTHTHGVSGQTAGAGEEGTHTHGVGTLAGSQPTHNHAISGTTGNPSVDHTHFVSGTSGDNNLNHTHNMANHTHSSGTLGQPKHRHIVPASGGGGYTTEDGDDAITGSTGTPSTNVTTQQSQDHQHSISFTSSGRDVPHVHSISFTSGAGGNQAVTIAGETAAGGAGASHNHSISLVSAAGGADAITITGDMANAGGSTKTYPDQLKVYIDNIEKTAQVLAKTGLTQFGDGTVTHAFVTTGSGEMDISDLIIGTGIHEIKISEPISAKGGRCCVHVEVY